MVDQKQTPLFRVKANLEIRSKACQPKYYPGVDEQSHLGHITIKLHQKKSEKLIEIL